MLFPYFLAATAASFIVFFLVFRHNKTRMTTSLLFLGTVFLAGLSYAFIAFELDIHLMYYPLLLVAFILLLVLMFGLYAAIALLLLNARLVYKRERRSLANSLTLILALLLIVLVVVGIVMQSVHPPRWLSYVWSALTFVFFFYFFHIFLFLTSVLLSNLARPAKKQNYIVVLGSGLIDGQVPPLLAARINKAISFYQKQAKKTTPPKLVMSGGQGADEPRAEAEAMAEYAINAGIPANHVLIEAQSKTTRENMEYSKKMMDADFGGTDYRCIYATNNYHVLRAGILARKAGLPMDGIGAKTAWYYLPNALLREYIAHFAMNKVRLLVLAVLLFLFFLFLQGLPWLLRQPIANFLRR